MIRPAEPADYRALRAIQEAALDEHWPDLLELGVDGPPICLVAETDRPVGYALVVDGDDVAYVAELAVAPAEQGQGYGSELLAALLDRLRSAGFETIRLTARADDDRVRSFYETFGFDAVDEVPDHYDDGDAVVLARSL
ncbi:ribosomal-protein-alanine N-acetyltransferase [Halomicrobium zhouii]|uniref:Ribosomal-protein-alanine N-acetyltransferase n=1 Tax=Halomicrobium zhouii TaxID=767519 RepID=A0A1I6KQK2_9EURY|nr:GNAT family N-acetyltransferase [Halomicrobium zhouii]SFR93525.1 ribosomal-protein-alanine N-acetyltransferase [Halomicrobium zhouii]